MSNLKFSQVDLIGLLADDHYVYESTGKYNSIFVNSQNYLQFWVKVVSDTPDGFPNIKLFTCYSSDLEKYGFEDDFNSPDNIREKKLIDFLQDHLIVFKPNRKKLYNHEEIYQCKNIRLIPKNDTFQDSETLTPVPIFNERDLGISYDDFLRKVVERKYLGRIDNISTEANDTPQIILFKRKDGTYMVIGEFVKHQYAHGGFCLSYIDGELKEPIPFDEDWLDHVYEVNGSVLFVNLETFQYIIGALQGADAITMPPTPTLEEQGSVVPVAPIQDGELEVATTLAMEIGPEVPPLEAKNYQELVHSSTNMTKEDEFLDRFITITKEMGLQYSEKDLYNFHTAVKSNTLNILAGMSGTGKSKLVLAYGKALGLDDEQLTIIPVRSSWTDDADLIGYVDSMNMIYRPGDSGLINTLIDAQKEENKHTKLYIVCFDEMNLARVEHYFSQFLSVLEMEPNKRFLRLYNDDLTRLYNSAQYPPIIHIGSNILFMGTVNLDESTYHFSDKVLDRANVITLDILPYEGLRSLSDQREKRKHDKPGQKPVVTLGDFNEFKSNELALCLTEEETAFLWDVHNLMQSVSRNLGIGPRIVRQIDSYIKNLPLNPYLNREQAIDLQIVQRILTKLRGPEGLLKPLLGRVDSQGNLDGGSLYEIIDKYPTVSSFSKTKQVLIQKAKELRTNGYTV
jgi:hypothetical protein